MARNQHVFDAIIAKIQNPFNFDGELKLYIGLEQNESTAHIFKTEKSYLKFFRAGNFKEYIFIERSKKEIGIRFDNEAITFQFTEKGPKIAYYHDFLREDTSVMAIDPEDLKRELLGLFAELRAERPKKLSS